MQTTTADYDSFFYHEMMTHPALFTHPAPQKIAILGNHTSGILTEVLKHPRVLAVSCVDPTINHIDDARVKLITEDLHSWLTNCADDSYDIIIQTNTKQDDFNHVFRVLETDGIFVNPCPISLLDPTAIIAIHEQLKKAGFHAFQTLNFAQPSHAQGWRLLLMASKHSAFRLVKEKDVFNRSFTTRYYNYEIHKAALALPEFVKIIF